MTYRSVWELLADSSEDKTKWRYKRRGTVLGTWYAIKQGMWNEHVAHCVDDPVPF